MRNSIAVTAIILMAGIFASCGQEPQNNAPVANQTKENNQPVSSNRKTLNTTPNNEPIQESEKNIKETENQDAMETVYDMTENSFSISMPVGWQNIALMHRLQNSPRTLVTSIAPDRNSVIFIGDPGLPVYAFPNPQMEAMYRNVGMKSPNNSAEFVEAEQYFESYMQHRFANLDRFVIDEKFINQNVVAQQKKDIQRLNINPRISNISYRFHYESNGRTIRGVVNGCTIAVGAIWLPEVSGFCTTGEPEKMEEIMVAMGKSRVQNPAWQQQQIDIQNARHQQTMAQIDANTQQMTAQHNQRMANIQASAQAHQQRMANLHQANDAWNQNWANNQAVIDNGHKRFINSINNEHTVMDASGNTFQVDNYQDKYFVDKTNNTYIGTHGTVTLDDLRQIKGLNIDNFAETMIIR